MRKEHIILPDVIKNNLKIIFCGIAVGKTSAEVSGYYAKDENKFWGILCEIQLTDKKIRACEYNEMLSYKLGLTDLVKNQIGGDKNIIVTDNDCNLLMEKILKYKPKILAFNGKKAAKKFFRKRKIGYGEVDNIGKTSIWVLESTSPANGHWNNGKHWKQLAQKFIKSY